MKLLGVLAGAAMALACGGLVEAAPITVTDTVTGGPGAWVYDFSVTNNIGGTNDIYFFGVSLSTTNIVGSPTGWGYASWDNPWSNAPEGGSSTVYNNPWCNNGCNGGSGVIAPGQTVTGFEVLDNATTAQASVQWFAYAYGGTDYNADGHFSVPENPGFEGLTVAGGVPEPATWAMLILGVAMIGFAARRRSTSAALVA